VVAIVAGSVLTGGGLPLSSRLWLPVVYATMHCSWGWGFLTSPKKLSRPQR
jgi:succinoglycan biosynthesis protein ExoA